ncbi:MAG: acyl-CoA desaturase [Solirubrobacteraceae bacterium]|nr:acyl-CoA desaturase [Solirubrobacteraceae bacterium]
MTLSRTARIVNVVAVSIPFIGALVAVVLLWNSAVTWFDLAVATGMYLFGAFGITIGYHRVLTHGAAQAKPWLRYLLAIMGSSAIQGPVLMWVADHRAHHTHTDQEGDPHSPHVGGGSGIKGLFHAHMGWLWNENTPAHRPSKQCPDLVRDRGLVRISKAFPWIALATMAVPFLLGLAYYGTLAGALQTFVWGALVRTFFMHHVTWSINSICHFWGYRRFESDDHSTNNPALALLSLGESWHHNHHAFPRAAKMGMRWYEVDISWQVIRLFTKLGWMEKPVVISRERQDAKRIGAVPAPVAGD